MINAKEYLKDKGLKNPPLDSGISGGGDAPRVYASDLMEEYASEYKHAYDKVLEEKATDVSFHYAALEEETTEKIKAEISEIIYNAIPVGEVTAWDCIKIFKQLKADVEAL